MRDWQAHEPRLGVIHGRRRLGKTSLLRHWLKGTAGCYVQATERTPVSQRTALAEDIQSMVPGFGEVGHMVRTFSLDRSLDGAFPANVDEQIADVTDKSAVQSAMQGVDAVVHLAALLHIINPPPELREKYEKIEIVSEWFATKRHKIHE